MNEFVSTAQAAEKAGLSRTHVWALIDRGAVAAQRVGYVWMVRLPSLRLYMANRPRPGLKAGQKITRPRKQRPA